MARDFIAQCIGALAILKAPPDSDEINPVTKRKISDASTLIFRHAACDRVVPREASPHMTIQKRKGIDDDSA
jgi:hypothetical protein